MSALRRFTGLILKDDADASRLELLTQYQACCIKIMTGATVLEVGCGLGENSNEVSKRWNAEWYTGVDVSVGMVRDAKHRYTTVDFIVADGCSLPLRDSSFDVVTSSFVFHHIPIAMRRQALQEQLRVGKITALLDLFGMEPGWLEWLYRMYYVIFDGSEYRFTLQEWHKFIESAGGQVIVEDHSRPDLVRNRHCFFLIRRILSSGFQYDQVEDCCDS